MADCGKRRQKGCRSGGSDCNRREAWSNRLGPKPFPRLLREIPNSRSLKHLIALFDPAHPQESMRNSCLKASFFPDESRRVAYVKPDHIEERFQLAQSQFLPTPVWACEILFRYSEAYRCRACRGVYGPNRLHQRKPACPTSCSRSLPSTIVLKFGFPPRREARRV